MHFNLKAALYSLRHASRSGRCLAKFVLRMRINSYIPVSGQKNNPRRRIRRSDFPYGTDILIVDGHVTLTFHLLTFKCRTPLWDNFHQV